MFGFYDGFIEDHAGRAGARQTNTDAAFASRHSLARIPAGTITSGDRVLDIQTGQRGLVTGVGLVDGLRRDDARVSLEDGRVVVRAASALQFREDLKRG